MERKKKEYSNNTLAQLLVIIMSTLLAIGGLISFSMATLHFYLTTYFMGFVFVGMFFFFMIASYYVKKLTKKMEEME